MLSESMLRRIEDVDREATERRIREIYECRARDDIDRLIAYLAPDVALPAHGAWTGVAAPIHGRDEVAARLRTLTARFENIVSVVHEITIDGDRAVAHRTAVGRKRDTGARYQCDFIDFFRFRDGLVVEFSEYADAAWRKVAGR